jgi:phosphoserine phosphatase RsbU/P
VHVSGQVIRRVRLPPEGTSPAVARGVVDALLVDAGLVTLRNEALLLTSELVTNGVIHARTDVELEILADSNGLHVTVTDFAKLASEALGSGAKLASEASGSGAKLASEASGSAARTARPSLSPAGDIMPMRIGTKVPTELSPIAEGGRGLFLVSRFASRWGTSHEPGGQSVWFHLDLAGTEATRDSDSTAAPGLDAVVDTVAPSLDSVVDTVVGPGGDRDTPPTAVRDGVSALLGRLAKALGAATATVSVDRADGRGPRVLARHASADPANGRPNGRTVRVPLHLSRPWTGELTATGACGPHAVAVAALTAGQLALLVEYQRLQEAHNERRGWLLFLAEAGELLAQSMNVELTAALIPRLVVPRLGLWCAVHMTNEYSELIMTAVTHADETAIPRLAAELKGAAAALHRLLTGGSFAPLGPPTDGMSFPLAVRGERLGTLTVGRPAGRAHVPDELAIIEDLGRRAAVAIDNARVHEHRSRIATALQRSLLPPALPTIDGLEVAAQYVPAGDGLDVGGDFYDIVALPGQSWMFVVGDVSGKGVGAAAVTGLVREVLHTLALDHHEPVDTLSRLNARLVDRGGGYFCTLALAFLTAAGPGSFEVVLHLAGHEQPVLLHADGEASLVGECGTALGLLQEISAKRTTIRLTSGDALVFYTDGVTERRKGRAMYGQRRLCTEISSLAGSPAAVLASQLRSSVLAFSPSSPRDDIAILALRAQ